MKKIYFLLIVNNFNQKNQNIDIYHYSTNS